MGPILNTNPQLTLAQYEERAFAQYFLDDIRYPYISHVLMTAVSVWALLERHSGVAVGLWVLFGVGANLAREGFARHMRPKLARGEGYVTVLRGFTLAMLFIGMYWGVFVWMHLDPADPLTVMLAGAYVAGHVGGAVTPLSIFLPAYYVGVIPTVVPGVWLLAATGEPLNLALAALTTTYLFAMTGYAHITNRLHRESMRLRHDNQRLIHDLELRKAQAEEASRTKSLFLAGVSHDLKQPIRAIAMYSGYLRHLVAPQIERQVVLQTAVKIDAAVGSVQNQISRLLELSQLETGAMPVRLEPLDLDEVLRHVRDEMAQSATSHAVTVRFASGRSYRVLADRRMLESILANFVSNAIRHSPGGRVYVGTRLRNGYPEGQRLCIEVRDNGTGIEAHLQPLLFDAYRSFDDRRSSDGHGLGLAIAKTQATYLTCDIQVRSKSGAGSTFTLCGLRTLPGEARHDRVEALHAEN
jgi:hypothetical protein